MERKEKLNLSMLFDFYEMTMANGYFRQGLQDRITYFDVFFRRVPDGGGYAIAAGLEQLVDYIRDSTLTRRILPICGVRACSRRTFWTICAPSASPATSGRCRRGRRYFPTSPSSPFVPPLPKPSSSRPTPSCASTTRALSPPRPAASSGRPRAG